jgi:hypothetical protein
VSIDSRPRLLVEVGSDAATSLPALDPASLQGWALVLPCAPQLQTPLPHKGGLRRCHMAHNSGLCLLWGELRCSHVSHGSQCPVGHGNKERHSCTRHQLGSHISKARSRVTKAPTRCADKQGHYNLQDMWTCRYSAARQCSAVRLARDVAR